MRCDWYAYPVTRDDLAGRPFLNAVGLPEGADLDTADAAFQDLMRGHRMDRDDVLGDVDPFHVDPVSDALCAHLGLDVPGWALAEKIGLMPMVKALGMTGIGTATRRNEALDMEIPLGRDATWCAIRGRTAITLHEKRALPEMVAMAMAGRPLTDLVRHPVLDGFDLEIVRITSGSFARHVAVRDREARHRVGYSPTKAKDEPIRREKTPCP